MTTERVTTFKIFVGNVVGGTTGEEIRKLFEQFGTVVGNVEIISPGTKAFLHMEDDVEGKNAIEQLQGHQLYGNVLKIEESISRKHELPKIPTVKLLVKNVSPNTDARGLRSLFRRFGFVVEVVLENGEGYVSLEATGDIGSAIKEMNGHVIDDCALEVVPAPQQASSETTKPQKQNKFNNSPQKNRRSGRDNSWNNAYNFHDNYQRDDYYEDYQDDYGYQEPSHWEYNDSQFHPPPERILRDPHSRPRVPNMRPRFPGPGPSGFRGPSHMMGGPPRMFPPRPPMNFGMHPRGPRGGPPMRIPRNSHDNRFQQQQQPNPFAAAAFQNRQEQDDVPFYEDEPIVSVPRDLPRMNRNMHSMSLSGANSVPVGGGGESFSFGGMPPPEKVRRNGKRGGMRRPWKPPAKFTAVTHDIAPGEKYPVPPANNPSFRAPLKWQKEEVRRKVKRKKKPLVPAELPDYSLPVPELPRPTIPQGAVLKPFPPPASTNNHQHDNNESHNNQIDFTSDDY